MNPSVLAPAGDAAPALSDFSDVPVTLVRYRRLIDEISCRVPLITPAEFASLAGVRRPLLIDVREEAEWQAGRAEGSIHLPRSLIESQIEQVVPDAQTPLVCLCARSSRALLAADSLLRLGYVHVQVLAGGFAAWQAAGLRVTRTPAALRRRSFSS